MRRSNTFTILYLTIFLFLFFFSSAYAGIWIYSVISEEEIINLDPDSIVADVTFTKMNVVEGTNAAPPSGNAKINELFRGTNVSGTIDIVWTSEQQSPDTGSSSEWASWNGRPLVGPSQGERWLLILKKDQKNETYSPVPRCRYRYSQEKKDWLKSVVKTPDQIRTAQKKAQEEYEIQRKESDRQFYDLKNQWKTREKSEDIKKLFGTSADVLSGDLIDFAVGLGCNGYAVFLHIDNIWKGSASLPTSSGERGHKICIPNVAADLGRYGLALKQKKLKALIFSKDGAVVDNLNGVLELNALREKQLKELVHNKTK